MHVKSLSVWARFLLPRETGYMYQKSVAPSSDQQPYSSESKEYIGHLFGPNGSNKLRIQKTHDWGFWSVKLWLITLFSSGQMKQVKWLALVNWERAGEVGEHGDWSHVGSTDSGFRQGQLFRFGPNSLGDSRRLCMGFSVLGCKTRTASIPGWCGYTSPSFLGLWRSQWTNKLQFGRLCQPIWWGGKLTLLSEYQGSTFCWIDIPQVDANGTIAGHSSDSGRVAEFSAFLTPGLLRSQRRVGVSSCDWAHPKVTL